MLRSGLVGGSLFLVAALFWTAYDPLFSLWEVAALSSKDSNYAEAETALLQRGTGAIWALRRGLHSADEVTRLRCARLLALQGEEESERILLEALRQGNGSGALAERLILSVWEQRKGPENSEDTAALQKKLRTPETGNTVEQDLTLKIMQYPAWASGYVARARYNLGEKDLHQATQDALTALLLEPDHFEAMVILGRCFLKLGYPERALDCFERALLVNPRLASELDDDLKAARTGAASEREHRFLERRAERPVL